MSSCPLLVGSCSVAIASALHPDLRGDFDVTLEVALSSASAYRAAVLQRGERGYLA